MAVAGQAVRYRADVDAIRIDENLRQAMQQETGVHGKGQLRGDRSVTDLVTANYTFVNERLAKPLRNSQMSYGGPFPANDI